MRFNPRRDLTAFLIGVSTFACSSGDAPSPFAEGTLKAELQGADGATSALGPPAEAANSATLAGSPVALTTAEEAVPEFDFDTCPDLPADADPALWRCEVMIAVSGHLKLGAVDQPIRPIQITFAEGRIGGENRQVFGELRAEPMPIVGLGPRLSIQAEYAGYSDFLSNDERRGELNLKFRMISPLLPRCASIGDDEDPIALILRTTVPARVVSAEPLIVAFSVEDNTFAAPGVKGGGGLGAHLGHRLGLPSSAGENQLSLDAYVGIRGYAALP